MQAKYVCPYCASQLNVNDQVVLTAKNQRGQQGLLLLHTDLGNYACQKNEDFQIEKGEHLNLYCPVCREELYDSIRKNMAKLIREEPDGSEFTVVFSRVWGEKATFAIHGEKLSTYGEHAIRYQNPEWYFNHPE